MLILTTLDRAIPQCTPIFPGSQMINEPVYLNHIPVLGTFTNSAVSVKTPKNSVFDQVLHCLLTDIPMPNTDGSFTMAVSNSLLSPSEKLP